MLKPTALIYSFLATLTILHCPVHSGNEGLDFVGISKTPQSRVTPGGVLVLKTVAINRSATPAEGTIVASVEGAPDMQSARKIQLGPEQQLPFELYVQLPQVIDQGMLEITATMYVEYGGREVLHARNGVPVSDSIRLSVAQQSAKLFALAVDAESEPIPPWYWPQQQPYGSYEFPMATRIDAGRARYSANFDIQPLPLNMADWESIDLLVVAEDKMLRDAAAVEAIKRFLFSGGRVWVMLDRLDCDLVRPLLGTDQVCELVDEVELSEFVAEVHNSALDLAESDRRVSLEQDAKMKRVLQIGGNVMVSVNSWPAAIEMSVGYGHLYLTTLDSRAWIKLRKEQQSFDDLYQSNYESQAWANAFALEVNAGRSPLPMQEEVEYPLKYIGNPVVPRQWVAIALLGFCSVLALGGMWRCWAGDMSTLGFIAPLLALVASGGLLLASTWIRRDIPESVSRLQVVEFGGGGSFALAREQGAIFLDAANAMRLEGKSDGRAVAGETMSSGIRRFEIEDFQKWSLTNPAWPPGTSRYRTQFVFGTQGMSVAAHFTAGGLHLEMPAGLPSPLEDPVLGFVRGDPLLCRPATDGYDVDGSITVDAQRWIAGSIISDEQQRRLEIYSAYFRPDEKFQRPPRMLYGWTELWDGPQWQKQLTQNGFALVALPVELQRPATGDEVYVPHGLIQLRRKLGELGNTSAFNDATGKWVKELSMGTEAQLEFVLPAEVVPIAVDAIDLELDIRAPQRTVTVSVVTPTGNVLLTRLESPSIPWQQRITDPALLAEAADGVWELVLQVSERSAGGQNVASWQVDHFHASLRGRIQ